MSQGFRATVPGNPPHLGVLFSKQALLGCCHLLPPARTFLDPVLDVSWASPSQHIMDLLSFLPECSCPGLPHPGVSPKTPTLLPPLKPGWQPESSLSRLSHAVLPALASDRPHLSCGPAALPPDSRSLTLAAPDPLLPPSPAASLLKTRCGRPRGSDSTLNPFPGSQGHALTSLAICSEHFNS